MPTYIVSFINDIEVEADDHQEAREIAAQNLDSGYAYVEVEEV